MARKTLLAVAGLVSVHDRTWTTDRTTAAHRWAQVELSLASGLRQLLEWTDDAGDANAPDLEQALVETVRPIVAAFAERVGLWS